MVLTQKKEIHLKQRMSELGIKESDLVEKFVLGSGKGGQKINKTASCVYLKHIPTGIEVKCHKERTQKLNRFFARQELCDLIAKKVYGEKNSKRCKTRQEASPKKKGACGD